jgi:integrase
MSRPHKHGKKWQVRWFDEHGKRLSAVFDSFKDAEFALKRLHAEVEDIRRGFAVRPPTPHAFPELAERWMTLRGNLKRRPKDDRAILTTHLLPAFGQLTLQRITSERIAELSAELGAKRAPQTVRNVLGLLGTMLRMAIEWGWLDSLPKIRKPKIRLFNADYRWLRSNDEISRFLESAKAEELHTVYPMYSTAIYAGMRAGELAGLQWRDIDFDRRLITVQRSYDGPTKAGDIRHVPILDRLLPVLKEWRLACGSRLVFPNGAGEMWDQKGRIFDSILRRVLIRADFHARYVHFHGLRHTFASHWVLNGGDIFRLQKILGHKSSQVTQRYAHLAPAAYESDWNRFGDADTTRKGEVLELKTIDRP